MIRTVAMLMIWMQKIFDMTKDQKMHNGGGREESFGPQRNDLMRTPESCDGETVVGDIRGNTIGSSREETAMMKDTGHPRSSREKGARNIESVGSTRTAQWA